MLKHKLIFTSLLTSTILLSGCTNPLLKLGHTLAPLTNKSVQKDQTESPFDESNDNSNQPSPALLNIQDLMSNLANQNTIDNNAINVVVNYFQAHQSQADLNSFNQHGRPIINNLANQSINFSNNLNVAILDANVNWPNFVTDYRKQPRKLLYIYLTKGSDHQLDNDDDNSSNGILTFTPTIAKQAVNHIFKMFPQKPSPYALETQINPITGNPITPSPALQNKFDHDFITNNLNPQSPLQKSKGQILNMYHQVVAFEQKNHIGTAKQPDNDKQRARIILSGYLIQNDQKIDTEVFESNDENAHEHINQLLTTKYHFTDDAIEQVIQDSQAIPEVTSQITSFDNQIATTDSLNPHHS